MNWLERWFIKRAIAKEVRQGHHDKRIEHLYGMINEALEAEFTEDNKPTLVAYAHERLAASLETK